MGAGTGMGAGADLAGPAAPGGRQGRRSGVLVVAGDRPRRGDLLRDGGAHRRAARPRDARAHLGRPRARRPVRPFRPGGVFFSELAVRLGRPWLAGGERAPEQGLKLGGPLFAGPLLDCMGTFTRIRRGQQHPDGYELAPWWLRTEHRPASARVQLRTLAEQAAAARGGGSTGDIRRPWWRAHGPAPAARPVQSRHRRIHRRGDRARPAGVSGMRRAGVCTDSTAGGGPSSPGPGERGPSGACWPVSQVCAGRARLAGAHDRHAQPARRHRVTPSPTRGSRPQRCRRRRMRWRRSSPARTGSWCSSSGGGRRPTRCGGRTWSRWRRSRWCPGAVGDPGSGRRPPAAT